MSTFDPSLAKFDTALFASNAAKANKIVEASNDASSNFWLTRRLFKFKDAVSTVKGALWEINEIDNKIKSNNVEPSRFFNSDSSYGKTFAPIDKSLIDFKGVQKLLGVELSTTEVEKSVRKGSGEVVEKALLHSVEGTSKTGVRIAKLCAKVPFVGFLIDMGFQVPAIVDACKKDKGTEQVIKSTTKVVTSTAAMAIGSTIGTMILPGAGTAIGSLLGGIAGATLGSKGGEKLGECFAKLLPDKDNDD